MPASGTVASTAAVELTESAPLVYINGGIQSNVFAHWVELHVGMTPGKALFQAGGNDLDIPGPMTLHRYAWDKIMPYSRVKVVRGGHIDFVGTLKRRHDTGQKDTIVWEAWDDRWLLSKIPLLGCLVYDRGDNEVKFFSGYSPVMNPGGMRNCVGAAVPGFGTVPVFSAFAEAADREDNIIQQNAALTAGELRAWTPRMWLWYLCVVANLTRGAVKGSDIKAWRSIAGARIQWTVESLNFGASWDMDHKIPETSLRGKKLLGAIGLALEHAHKYGLRVDYDDPYSYVSFYIKDSTAPSKKSIYLQRGGAADDINTAHDFDLDEDWANAVGAMAALGARPVIEAQVQYDAASATDCLEPAWTAAVDAAARKCLWGGPDVVGPPAEFALYPSTVNDTSGEFLVADGNGGRPMVRSCTGAAVALVRQCYPQWMRAFRLKSDKLYSTGPLKAFDGRYAATGAFPYLNQARAILAQQLTFVLDTNGKKTKERWPIRIQVSDLKAGGASSKWHDVTAQAGLHVKEDHLIYLDGLTDENAGADLIYTGTMMVPWLISLRGIRINCAFQCDHRILGYQEQKSRIHSDLAAEMGGPLEDLIDGPEAWRFESRVASVPFASIASQKDDGTTHSYPATDMLLDESEEATKHAAQKVYEQAGQRAATSWRMIGVRDDYRAGDFIDRVICVGGTNDSDYRIDAPLDIVTLDYLRHETVLGNVAEHTRGGMLASSGSSNAVAGGNQRGIPQQQAAPRTKAAPYKPDQGPEPSQQQPYKPGGSAPYKPEPDKPYQPEQAGPAAPKPYQETPETSAKPSSGDAPRAGLHGPNPTGEEVGKRIMQNEGAAQSGELLRNMTTPPAQKQGILSGEDMAAKESQLRASNPSVRLSDAPEGTAPQMEQPHKRSGKPEGGAAYQRAQDQAANMPSGRAPAKIEPGDE